MKRSFSVIEMLLAISLIVIVYSLLIKSSPKNTDKKILITLENIKEFLFTKEFEETITLRCFKTQKDCFLYKDNSLHSESAEVDFNKSLDVYKYDTLLEKVEFIQSSLDSTLDAEISFELKCFRDGKCNEYILETSQGVFILSNLAQSAIKVDSLEGVNNYFNKKISEVKHAF